MLKARRAHIEKQMANLQKESLTQLKGRLNEVRPSHYICWHFVLFSDSAPVMAPRSV